MRFYPLTYLSVAALGLCLAALHLVGRPDRSDWQQRGGTLEYGWPFVHTREEYGITFSHTPFLHRREWDAAAFRRDVLIGVALLCLTAVACETLCARQARKRNGEARAAQGEKEPVGPHGGE